MLNFDGFWQGFSTGIRLAFQLPGADDFKIGFGWIILIVLAVAGAIRWIFRRLRP